MTGDFSDVQVGLERFNALYFLASSARNYIWPSSRNHNDDMGFWYNFWYDIIASKKLQLTKIPTTTILAVNKTVIIQYYSFRYKGILYDNLRTNPARKNSNATTNTYFDE
jgi:hypothetical protein